MSSHLKQRVFSGLCAFSVFLLGVLEVMESDSQPGMVQEFRTTVADLTRKGRTYLGRLVEEQTLLSVEKTFSQVVGTVAGVGAGGLNVVLQYISEFLQAAGIQVGLPINKVTPERLIFVTQWLLVALICYRLISLVFQLVAWLIRILKVGVPLACFGLVLKEYSVGTLLLFVCILLYIAFWVIRKRLMKLFPWKSWSKSLKKLKERVKLKKKEEQKKK